MEEQKLEHLPVLLMVNKQDIQEAISAEAIVELFEVANRPSRKIRIQLVSGLTGYSLFSIHIVLMTVGTQEPA